MNRRERKSQRCKKDVKPVFRILTEGGETEPRYIEGYIREYLQLHDCFNRVVFAHKPKNHDPYSLLLEAKKQTKEIPADCIWIVFDLDGHDKIAQTFTEAKMAEVEIAFSSISFETWLLMHFEYTATAYGKCDDLVSDTKHFKRFFPDYEKSRPELFATVTANDGLNLAKKHARKLCESMMETYPKTPIYKLNPYTDFYRLLEAIDQFVGK